MDPSSCVYEYIENGESDTVQVLQCITDMTHKSNSYFSDANTVLFLVYAASIVFLMQSGFAMVCSGSVRQKNVQNTMLKNLLDVCGSSLAFYFLGYGFAYGGDENGKPTFIGNSNFLLLDMSDDNSGTQYAHWLFEFAFAATSGESFVSLHVSHSTI